MAVLMRQPPSSDDRDPAVRVGVGIASGQIRREVREAFEERFGAPMLEETRALLGEFVAARRELDLPAQPGRGCRHCPHRPSCPAGSRWLEGASPVAAGLASGLQRPSLSSA